MILPKSYSDSRPNMDLRNLSSTPNQLDTVMQRRPSLSSLSSTSGYASSSYGGGNNSGGGGGGGGTASGANTNGNATPQLNNLRLAAQQGRNFANLPNSSNSNLPGSSWSSASGGGANVGAAVPKQQNQLVNNVGPWVEQQQKQQQQTFGPIDSKAIESLDKTLKPDAGSQKPGINPSAGASSAGNNNASNNNSNNASGNILSNNNSNNEIDDDVNDIDDDELIPTAIVIKNIPFAIKKEQLLDVMTKLNLPLPYAFNYHFDNGVFRGLAFANFTSTDETSLVVNQLNGREIGGRKLRVEYKKMLPVQERERIEREKREKRGQLEEQHRSNSTASLASLLSAASTTAATKNLSINGNQGSNQTERLFITYPFNNLNINLPPSELNFNDPEILELYSQLILFRDDNSKAVFELAFPSNLNINNRKILSILCSFLNLLELYDNGLIIVRRKPGQQSIQQRHQQNINNFNNGTPSANPNGPLHSSSMMNLSQLTNLIPNNNNNTPNNANNIPNGNMAHPPELLRSQSQSALPLPRLRQQTSTPVQQQFPQYQGNPSSGNQSQNNGNSGYPPPLAGQPQGRSYPAPPFNPYQQLPPQSSQSNNQQNVGTPTSAAALLRSSNNRSFVDVRSTPPLTNTFSGGNSNHSINGSPTPQHSHAHHQHQHHQSNSSNLQKISAQQPPTQQTVHQLPFFADNSSNQMSQPSTPLANSEISSRFAPFGQHAHLTGSFSSLQPSSATTEEFPDAMSGKFNNLNLANNSFNNSNNASSSGIWGPK